MRVVFMGSAEISCVVLARLLETPEVDVVGVVTQPDRPRGRRLQLAACPARVFAEQSGIPVMAPDRIGSPEACAAMTAWRPDVAVVLAYGQILSPAVLAIPGSGCMNIHTSLLPRYRGAAPIQRSIAAGELVSGVTVIQMDAGMDTGDILGQTRVPIDDRDTAQDLHDRLASVGGDLIVKVLAACREGRLVPRAQDEARKSLAPRLSKAEGRIDWTQPARRLYNQIRGYSPWPGSYGHLAIEGRDAILKIWKVRELCGGGGRPGMLLSAAPMPVVACGEGALVLEEVQPSGGRRMSGSAYMQGRLLPVGEVCFQ